MADTADTLKRALLSRSRMFWQRTMKAWKRGRKAYRRLRDPARRSATSWCTKNASDLDKFARRIDEQKWQESLQAKQAIKEIRKVRLSHFGLHGSRPQDIGGGPGNLALLYWLVRLLKPKCVVETGVASGASSQAILKAMEMNERGHLFSSDLSGVIPREYAGICVDPELRHRWVLLHDGDRLNIPIIRKTIDTLDILHYDSAKDAREMNWVVSQLSEAMDERSVLVLDDIDRHGFMADYVARQSRSWYVFGSVGVIGLDEALTSRGATETGFEPMRRQVQASPLDV